MWQGKVGTHYSGFIAVVAGPINYNKQHVTILTKPLQLRLLFFPEEAKYEQAGCGWRCI